jgi:hypothetical protein
MDKGGELEASWRGHVEAWRASGGTQKAYCAQHGLKSHSLSYWHLRLAGQEGVAGEKGSLTLVAATLLPDAVSSLPSLSLHSPQGWRLEFATLPPAGWLSALCGERV